MDSRGIEFLNEWIEHTFNPWYTSMLASIPNANTLNELLDWPHRTGVNKVIIALNIAIQYACHRKCQPYSHNLTPQEFEDLQNGAIKVLENAAMQVQMNYLSRLEKAGFNDKVVPYTINTANYVGENSSVYNWNGKNYDVTFNIFGKIRTEERTPDIFTKSVTTTTAGTTRRSRCGWFCRAWGTIKAVVNVVVPGGFVVTGAIDIILDLLDIMEMKSQFGSSADLTPNVGNAAQVWLENKFKPFYESIAISLGNPSSLAQLIDPSYVGRINRSIAQFQIARVWYKMQKSKVQILGLNSIEKDEYFNALDKMLSDAANGIATAYANELKARNYNKLSLGTLKILPSSIKDRGIENYVWTSKDELIYKGFVGNFTIGGGTNDGPFDGGGNTSGGTDTTGGNSDSGGTVLDGPKGDADYDISINDGAIINDGSGDGNAPGKSKTNMWPWIIGGAVLLKVATSRKDSKKD